jgi:hypothetical protein
MKIHTATMIAGIIFIIVGTAIWWKYDVAEKMFSLGVNLMAAGIGIIFISVLAKFKKMK